MDAATNDQVSADAITTELEKILTSPDFVKSRRMKGFLSFVVEETLKGQADQLKEYSIALEVFDRDASFDPTTNALVRVEAGRLRRTLKQYYLTYGRDDPVRIDIPKGAYIPAFSSGQPARAQAPAADRDGGYSGDDRGREMAAGATEPARARGARGEGPAQRQSRNGHHGPTSILVVDDEPQVEALITQRFRRRVRDGSLSFLFAGDGEEALDILLSNPHIDLVLTDINMPRMDGLSLLDHLDQIDPLLVSVVVSAYGDMDNIRTAMNRGAFDFVTKPINFEDLSLTIDKSLAQGVILRDAAQEHDQLEALRRELATASRFQEAFSPVDLTGNGTIDVAGATERARQVGGDFYDYFPLNDGRIAVLVAEVSGRGVPAALGAAVCRSALRTSLLSGRSIESCVQDLNSLLSGHATSLSSTLFLAAVEPATGSVDCINAAQKLPYIVRANGAVEPLDCPFGPQIGSREDAEFEVVSFTLEPGESLFLYTDGVTSAFNRERRQFSIQRLEDELTDKAVPSAEALVNRVMGAVKAFADGADYEDDLTALVVRRTAT